MSTGALNVRGRRLRQVTVASGLALALTTTAFAGTAAAESDDTGPENLLSCIVSKGATAPGPEGITNAWIDQVVAAARSCGVELPEALIAEVRRRANELDAKRACLEAAALSKPTDGQLPTREQIAAYAAAARTCGFGGQLEPPKGGDSGSASSAPKEQAQPAAKARPRPAAKKRQRSGSRSTPSRRSTRRGTSRR